MNKNIIWILLIFLIPLGLYFGLTRNELAPMPAIASTGNEIIKFGSPMCYECQELEKNLNEICPKYENLVTVIKVDVSNRTNDTQALIEEYGVKLVPTTVFKNKNGKITRRVEGSIKPELLESYIKELINE